MKRSRRIGLGLAGGVTLMLVYLLGMVTHPGWLEARWIRLTSSNRADAHDRLHELLRVGMTPSQVQRLLGEPDFKQAETRGFTWTYSDSGDGSMPSLLVQFYHGDAPVKIPGASPRVCYFIRDTEAHWSSFPAAHYWPTGQPLQQMDHEYMIHPSTGR